MKQLILLKKLAMFVLAVMSLSVIAFAEESFSEEKLAIELKWVYAEDVDLDVSDWAIPDGPLAASELSPYEQMKASVLEQIQQGKEMIVVKNLLDEPFTADKLYFNTLYAFPEETAHVEVTRVGCEGSYDSDNVFHAKAYNPGEIMGMGPRYLTEQEFDETAFKDAVDAAEAACFREDMTDLEKIVAAHDWLVMNCQYDPYVANGENEYTAGGVTYKEKRSVYSAYGVFVEGNAVCQGYALAFQALMNRVKIPCCFVNGDGHAWNAVQLDGDWYYVDSTFDDPVNIGDTGDFMGRVGRENFLKGEGTFSASHYIYAPWSTEYGYSISGSDYALPEGLKYAANMAAYREDDVFYLISGGYLQSYGVGDGFENGSAVISSSLPRTKDLTAAAVDWESRMMYYNSCYTDAMFTYAVNMKSGSVELIYQNDKDDVKVCGLKLVQRGDSDVRELWTWYDYSGVDKILEIDSYTEVEDGGYSYNMNGDTVRIKREDTASVVVVVWIGDGGRFLRADLCTGNQSYTVPTGAKTLKILAVEDAESWMPLCAAEKPDL